MEKPVWLAHYWEAGRDEKRDFPSAKDAYEHLVARDSRGTIVPIGVIFPDGHEVKHPMFGKDEGAWNKLVDPPKTTTLAVGGHAFINDEYGIHYEESDGYHDYIECARCGQFKCPCCDESFLTEPCPEYGNTLPGLDV